MSARLDTETLTQSNNIAASSVYFAMFWIKFNDKPLTSETIFSRKSTDGTQYVTVFYSADYEALLIETCDGVNPPTLGNASNLFDEYLGVWKLITIEYHGTPASSYRTTFTFVQDNGYSNHGIYGELNLTGLTFNTMVFGSGAIDIEVAYFREWDVILTDAEVLAEVQSTSAVKTAITDTPLASDLLDDSGNSNDWGSAPTLTYTAAPTLPVAPANNTEATAFLIPSLPYEATRTDMVSQGFVFTLWYKYIPTADDREISVKFTGTSSSAYLPWLDTYIDDSSKLMWETTPARMQQFPTLEGRPLLFELTETNNASTTNPSVLTISILHVPVIDIIPYGSIFIRGGGIPTLWITYGYPGITAGFIDSSTGEIIHFLAPFPPGESGDILPSGIMLFGDDFETAGIEGRITLYDNDFSVITNLTWPWTGYYGWPFIRASREFNKFYVISEGSPAKYMTVDPDGTMSADVEFPVGALSGILCGANSHDDLSVYLSRGSDGVLLKYTKSGAGLTELVAGYTGGAPDYFFYQIRDMLVMATGEIVALYQNYNFGAYRGDMFVRIIDPDGTILRTYTPPATLWYTSLPARLGYADDASISFWLFLHLSGPAPEDGFSRFFNLRLSDLAVLEDFMAPDSNYLTRPRSTTPDYRFATSDSCPMIVSLVPVPDKSGIYYKKPTPTATYPPPTVRYDRYYTSDNKIPNPTIRTALLGE